MGMRQPAGVINHPCAPTDSRAPICPPPQPERAANGETVKNSTIDANHGNAETFTVDGAKELRYELSPFWGFLLFLSLLWAQIFSFFSRPFVGLARSRQGAVIDGNVALEDNAERYDEKQGCSLPSNTCALGALDELDDIHFDSETDVNSTTHLCSPFDRGYHLTQEHRLFANKLARDLLLLENPQNVQKALRVHACTWNLGGQPPFEDKSGFDECLLGKNLMKKVVACKRSRRVSQNSGADTMMPVLPIEEFPDIVVVSLQEVEMGGVVLLKEHTETGVLWSEVIVDSLNRISERKVLYKKIKQKQLVGLVLVVVSRVEHFSYVTNVRTATIRTGAMRGVWGNKGSVTLRATIYGKRFLFVAAHFVAHKQNERIRTFNYKSSLANLCSEMSTDINDEMDVLQTFSTAASEPELDRGVMANHSRWTQFFRRLPKVSTALIKQKVLDKHDYIFFLGDLNSRLHGLKGKEIRRLVQHKEYDRLICYDELRQGMVSGDTFDGFQEAFIAFPPTYKFDRQTDLYDTSSKERDPAWCDRILFRASFSCGNDHEAQVGVRGQMGTQSRRASTGSCIHPGDHELKSHEISDHTFSKLPTYKKCLSASSDTVMQFSDSLIVENGDKEAVQFAFSKSFSSDAKTEAYFAGAHPPKLTQRSSQTLPQERDSSGVKFQPLSTFFSSKESICFDERSMIFPSVPNKVIVFDYHHVPHLRQSDHRPVCAQFEVRVFSFQKSLVDDLLRKVYEALPREAPDAR